MEGLEISEVILSDVRAKNRIDAECYRKYNLYLNYVIDSYNHQSISEFANVTDGEHGSPDLDENSGILYLSGHNVKDNVLDLTDIRYCSEELHNKNKRSALTKDSVLLSIVGTVGNASVVYQDIKANTDRNVATIKNISKFVNPYYLSTYLNSKFGKYQTRLLSTGNVQPLLNLLQVKSIVVCLPNNAFQNHVEQIVKTAHSDLQQSKSLYFEAEEMLLSELGLKDWQPNNNPFNIKQLKESFLVSGRLDAEYYQSKYDEIEKIIKTHRYDILDNLCLLINHGMQPPYVENGGMRVFSQKWIKDKEIDYSFIEDINEPRTSMEFAHSNPDYVCRKNDIVHYSVGANIGYCHTYLSNVPMMPGSFITLIRANEDKINPIYLGVVLNSIIGRIQSEKRKSGTAQPYVYPKDIKEFLIPILPKPIQDTISAKIRESFALKAESKRLLNKAKMMVESEIEKG